MPATQNLPDIQRGDTTDYTFDFDDGTNPIDMRGKTLTLTLKFSNELGDTDASFTKSVTPDVNDVAAQGGTVVLTLEHSETLDLVAGVTYAWSLRIIEPATPEDRETTYVSGDVTVVDS